MWEKRKQIDNYISSLIFIWYGLICICLCLLENVRKYSEDGQLGNVDRKTSSPVLSLSQRILPWHETAFLLLNWKIVYTHKQKTRCMSDCTLDFILPTSQLYKTSSWALRHHLFSSFFSFFVAQMAITCYKGDHEPIYFVADSCTLDSGWWDTFWPDAGLDQVFA